MKYYLFSFTHEDGVEELTFTNEKNPEEGHKLVKRFRAKSHTHASQQYYKYMNWGTYVPMEEDY